MAALVRHRRPFRRLLQPIERFLATESASGVVLIGAAALAFLWANSPWRGSYQALLELPGGISLAGHGLELPLIDWVNDALMALFFFVVGLEIKRELVIGELAGWRRAALPVLAALGGMVVPALIFTFFNLGLPSAHGWGVPVATDIAFAVGILTLLGSRVPLALKVFLLALAIVDDLGAVVLIAVFYTTGLNLLALTLAVLVWLLALLYGRGGGGRPAIYVVLGILLWYLTHESGIHATVAGVALATTVPLGPPHDTERLKAALAEELGGTDFEATEVRLEHLERVVERAQSPLHDFERTLQPWVAFAIMPLFALFNAGVGLGEALGPAFSSPITHGAFLGLLLGKPVGIVLFTLLATTLRLARRPPAMTPGALLGLGCLGGIGFTMSLFIGTLAFGHGLALDEAKIGVLAASIASALLGYLILQAVLPRPGAARARA